MSNPQPSQLYIAWSSAEGEILSPKKALEQLYSDGLQQYWDWLGESFYPSFLFNVDDFGSATAADLPSDASQQEIEYYLAAKDLASKLNS